MARYTQSQLERLNDAISLGALRVTYEDRTVEYRSLDQMREIRREMETDLGANAGGRSRRILPSTRKGV
jgi:hypothetical protein